MNDLRFCLGSVATLMGIHIIGVEIPHWVGALLCLAGLGTIYTIRKDDDEQ